MLDRLERKFGRYAIPDLTLYLVGAQLLFFVAGLAKPPLQAEMALVPTRVLDGEWWRVVTFLFMPPLGWHPIFTLFHLYLFYLMGTALEHTWGAFRYNLFLGIGALATAGAAFLVPGQEATNLFLYGSVFIAFAIYNPDFTIHLFFFIPVQMKWLAVAAGLFAAVAFLGAGWAGRFAALASGANLLLFFGPETIRRLRGKARRARAQDAAARDAEQPMHECVVCGATERSSPDTEFRYCPQCTGTPCYCMAHLQAHEHK